MIHRYDVSWLHGYLVKEEDGYIVRYTDHEAIIAEKDSRITKLEEIIKEAIQADIARQHGCPVSVVDVLAKALEEKQ